MCWPSYTRVATLYHLPYFYSNRKILRSMNLTKTHTHMFMYQYRYQSLALVYLLWLNDFKVMYKSPWQEGDIHHLLVITYVNVICMLNHLFPMVVRIDRSENDLQRSDVVACLHFCYIRSYHTRNPSKSLAQATGNQANSAKPPFYMILHNKTIAENIICSITFALHSSCVLWSQRIPTP